MSKQKNKNSLLAGHARASPSSIAREELNAMKYVMDRPASLIYPLADKPSQTYPDFCPWDEPDLKNEKLNNSNYLNKGYFENPLVSNEYYSARNLIQETLFSSSANCTKLLNELSLNLTNSFRIRNEVINKITHASGSFKLPPRVTMTALKREAWLKDLANPEVLLLQVCTKIPHGIRNKVLIDCMCNLNVPTTRAIWFTKCVLYSEQLLIRKKLLTKVNSAKITAAVDIMEARWVQEWTLHVADYLLKFSREMDNIASSERKAAYQQKLTYLLSFVKTLYMECLVDKVGFLSSIINFLREDQPFLQDDILILLELSRLDPDEDDSFTNALIAKLKPLNYGQTLLGLTLIKTFWIDILKDDLLCKATCEGLLLNYFLIDKIATTEALNLKSRERHMGIPNELKTNILKLISLSVASMFRHNSNTFIIPEFWIVIGDVLYQILLNDQSMAGQRLNIESTLKLISYRNESLMLNMKYSFKRRKMITPNRGTTSFRKNSFLLPAVQSGLIRNAICQPIESDFTCFGGSKKEILRFINLLDRNKLNNFLTLSLIPRKPNDKGYNLWKMRLKVAIYWCVTIYRAPVTSSVRILTFCNFLRRKVISSITGRGSSQLKAELENEILESVFSLATEDRESIDMKSLYVLINELYQLKIISISSYLRKIIACGIFYISPENEMDIDLSDSDPLISFHISILQNLPVLNNKQCDHILKKWTVGGSSFSTNFNLGTQLAQNYVLDGIMNNDFASDYEEFLKKISDLEMGVKFLIVNWLTTQIKANISKSPKLVHLSPGVMANIYKFYEVTDNLTVFYKVLVKFFLKNEDKIIIFYLETLYFVCKLLVNHFTLIKLIAGQINQTVSAASELFKLVLLSYKDIVSRETDIYRFQEIWEFISRSIEKPSALSKPNKEIGMKSILFEKETAESPLSMQSHASRRKDFYSPEEFHADLERFTSADQQFMTEEELIDCFADLNIKSANLDSASFVKLRGTEEIVLSLLDAWFSATKVTEKQDLSFFKLIEESRKQIKISMGDEFYSAISTFIFSRLDTNKDLKIVATFLRKLISYELFLVIDLLTMIDNVTCKINEQNWRKIISNLLFSSHRDNALLPNQSLMYEVLLSQYKQNNTEHLFNYALDDLKEDSVNDCRGQFEAVMNNLILNQRVALEALMRDISSEKLLKICEAILGDRSDVIKLSSLTSVTKLPNEFCLPVWQLMLNVLVQKEEPTKQELGDAALTIIKLSKFLFGYYNSFFGELFDQLSWEYRLELFYFFEESFFNCCTFRGSNNDTGNDSELFILRVGSSPVGMLPIFKDYFKKFSCPSVEKIETLSVLLQHITQFLKRLIGFVEQNPAKTLNDESVYNVVSIFLRLLIIHNATLVDQAGRSEYVDFHFFQSLVHLLNSEYLSSRHEKLQILLYDLLLIMKSLLTQNLSAIPSESLLETLPEASPTDSSGDFKGRQFEASVTSEITKILSILNLPEKKTSVFSSNTVKEPECIITLDDDELNHTSDICIVNNKRLELSPALNELIGIGSPFSGPKERPTKVFTMKSVALIEEASEGINNNCLNLALFDAYTTKENPL